MTDIVAQGADQHPLVASGNTITIDDKDVYDLTVVDGIAWQEVRCHLDGRYQGTEFQIKLRDGKRTGLWTLTTKVPDADLAEKRAMYHQLSDRMWNLASARIIGRCVSGVRAGREVVVGGGGGVKVVLGPAGVKKAGPFKKPVPWDRIAGASMDAGEVKVWWRERPDGGRKELVALSGAEINVKLLPSIVERLRPTQS